MPAGLFSLADILDQNGFKVRILHLGLMQSHDNDFDPAAYLTRHRPPVVGLSLHWFYSAAAIDMHKSACADAKNLSFSTRISLSAIC